jgi:hypothetical protein
MSVAWTGPLLAVVTVGTIWFGHVFVRKATYHFGTKPAPFVAGIGIAVLSASLFVDGLLLSAALGIVGIATLWDAFEIVRQEARIRRGHAPMNPKRPVTRMT